MQVSFGFGSALDFVTFFPVPPINVYCVLFTMLSYGQYKRLREEIDKYEGGLEVFSRGYEKFGFTRRFKHFHVSCILLNLVTVNQFLLSCSF